MNEPGCGVVGHSESCLCDVVITTPVAVNYTFDQVQHGPVVARAVGYNGETGGAQLADFLEALAFGYDAVHRLAHLDADWLTGVNDLRDKVAEHLQTGQSIIDLPELMGESFSRIVAAITRSQPNIIWAWDEMTWLRFESTLLASQTHAANRLADEFGLTWRMAETLIHLYGRQPEAERRADRQAQLNAILEANPGIPMKTYARLAAEAGVSGSYSMLQAHRLRWRRKHQQSAA